MKTRLIFLILIGAILGCKEQKDKALEYYKGESRPNADIERFGFDQKATPKPTPKVIIPFDDVRTREDAKSN